MAEPVKAQQVKSPIKSKVMWLNVVGIALTVLGYFQGWLENATPEQLTIAGAGWGLFNCILRAVTNSAFVFPKK